VTRIIVIARNAHEYDECSYALVEITPELARKVLARRKAWLAAHAADSEFYEAFYWDASAVFINRLGLPGEQDADLSEPVPGLDSDGWAALPADAPAPAEVDVCRTECDQMIVRDQGVAWYCIAKHTDVPVTTDEVPWHVFEAGAVMDSTECQDPECGVCHVCQEPHKTSEHTSSFHTQLHDIPTGRIATCQHCAEPIAEVKDPQSGCLDWYSDGGDSGCGGSPDTSDEGVGSHEPEEDCNHPHEEHDAEAAFEEACRLTDSAVADAHAHDSEDSES
jgi:hypothetical protein